VDSMVATVGWIEDSYTGPFEGALAVRWCPLTRGRLAERRLICACVVTSFGA
jgi:hypothetical protein